MKTRAAEHRLAELRVLQAKVEGEIRWLESTLRGERIRMATAICGTDGGYYRHVRGNKNTPRTKPCVPCKAAHRVAERERAARRRSSQENAA